MGSTVVAIGIVGIIALVVMLILAPGVLHANGSNADSIKANSIEEQKPREIPSASIIGDNNTQIVNVDQRKNVTNQNTTVIYSSTDNCKEATVNSENGNLRAKNNIVDNHKSNLPKVIKEGVILEGTFNQEGYSPYPMIMKITSVNSLNFEGTLHWKTLSDSVTRFRGSMDTGSDTVSFTEYEQIQGPYNKVVLNGNYYAEVTFDSLIGYWNWPQDGAKGGTFLISVMDSSSLDDRINDKEEKEEKEEEKEEKEEEEILPMSDIKPEDDKVTGPAPTMGTDNSSVPDAIKQGVIFEGTYEQNNYGSFPMIMTITEVNGSEFRGTLHWPSLKNCKTNFRGMVIDHKLNKIWFTEFEQIQGPSGTILLNGNYYAQVSGDIITGYWNRANENSEQDTYSLSVSN